MTNPSSEIFETEKLIRSRMLEKSPFSRVLIMNVSIVGSFK